MAAPAASPDTLPTTLPSPAAAQTQGVATRTSTTDADEPIEISDGETEEVQPRKAASSSKKRSNEVDSDDSDNEPRRKKSASKTKKNGAKRAAKKPDRANPQDVDERGHLKDLSHITPVSDDDDEDDGTSGLGKTADIDEFFSRKEKDANNKWKWRTCKSCKKARVAKTEHSPNVTSLRRHLNAFHRGEYKKWCKKTGFVSKLEPNVQARIAEAAAAAAGSSQPTQTMLDGHLVPRPTVRPILPFGVACTRFVAATDQAFMIVECDAFRDLILAAYHSKTEPEIPSCKVQRERVIDAAHDHFKEMRKYFAGPLLAGRISSTADCWSSDSQDGYFGVTGHWIERSSPGVWQLKSDLLAYTLVRYSHTGKRLGQALFKILERLGITQKFGYCTGDNLQVNDVMLRELENQFYLAHIDDWKADAHRLSCLAHTIHLPTRAFIDAREDNKNRASGVRAETTMVRNVSVLQRGSSIRKSMFHDIQTSHGVSRPRNLLRDLTIRWSSTKIMVARALELATDVDQLIQELARREKTVARRNAINKLFIDADEWANIQLFDDLLALPDASQQAFSAEQYPTLYNALPALCLLLASWEQRLKDAKYKEFRSALQPAVEKLRGYVSAFKERALVVLPYFVSMVLHPRFKLGPAFRLIWGDQTAALESRMEGYFKATYERLHAQPPAKKSSAQKPAKANDLEAMLADIEAATAGPSSAVQSEPYRQEYDAYLKSNHTLAEGITLVQFWGINESQWPTWAAIAADILPAMATSVSAERAFSSGGLTVTDQRSLLQGDAVEALQVLKSAMRNGLLMREAGPSTRTEMELVVEDSDDEGDDQQPTSRQADATRARFAIVLDTVEEDDLLGIVHDND